MAKKVFQGEDSRENSYYNKFGLSRMVSYLFLDCLTEADSGSTYTCVAETANEIKSHSTKITVVAEAPLLTNRELEVRPNSIDFKIKEMDSVRRMQTPSVCEMENKLSAGSAPRIYYFTGATVENKRDSALLHCRAIGLPKPEFTWYYNDKQVAESNKFHLFENGDLLINKIDENDIVKYKCVAHNNLGTDEVDEIFLYPTDNKK